MLAVNGSVQRLVTNQTKATLLKVVELSQVDCIVQQTYFGIFGGILFFKQKISFYFGYGPVVTCTCCFCVYYVVT